ncbi:MAG: acyl-CoA dehydrogenase [Rhodospirillales bacterium]
MTYSAPLTDMRFVLHHLCDLEDTARLPGFEEATPDLIEAVLEEASRMTAEVLAPLNQGGDLQGSRLVDGIVRTPDGWKEAYATFVEGGWNGAAFDPQYGGMGLPWVVNAALQEMVHAANMSFGLCPLLNQGAIEAVALNGSDDLKSRFLPKMVTGEWTGTMNLTEPQAGSDLGAVRTKAERQGDHYLITGQKIFITYGDHDLTKNIIHLVLARTPDAPAGVKGISLFVVPKILVADDGSLLEPNDVRCVSLEHKMGIHASPTAVLAFGDTTGAIGYLVGEENRGLEYMFVMMNYARMSVGLEGIGVAESAYQKARDYARERVQGKPIGVDGGRRAAIVHHPDVRRMLMTMKAQIEAMRAVAYTTARSIDFAHHHTDDAVRAHHRARLELLTPVIKGWSTELSVELTSLGVQVHGGMGYVEETGAAQYFRDARITTIYEGTTGIQAGDLVGRKIFRDGGRAAGALVEEIRALQSELTANDDPAWAVLRSSLGAGADALSRVIDWILAVTKGSPRLPAMASVHVLRLFGTVVGGYQMARAALAAKAQLDAGDGDPQFLTAKIVTARVYAEQIMPQVHALLPTILDGTEALMALDEEQL